MENITRKILLIVEDDAPLRRALQIVLAREGFEILEARDGKEGLELAFEKHPDMILLDIIMPVMDGITMLQKLRADDWGKEAKVIILTNLSDSEKVVEALQAGVHDFLVKTDWTINEVVEKVKDKLKK
ncbi:response regulator [Candidatus Uhrbacteria bacterium]|nr:response regulator [Candidatus Uhrbacteria bacterium]MBI4812247.1 response regulator [Candidatus Falkowbacteria bacterium]